MGKTTNLSFIQKFNDIILLIKITDKHYSKGPIDVLSILLNLQSST